MDRSVQLAVVVVALPVLGIGYLAAAEAGLRLVAPSVRRGLRPWLWLAPGLAFLGIFLVLPLVQTVVLSALDARSERFVGLDNFARVLGDPDFQLAATNSGLWLVALPAATIALGLALAVLTERVGYERAARALIFVPMAISFVAAAVIWKFMYDYRPPGQPQTGTINAVWTGAFDAAPVPWLVDGDTNNAAIIVAAVWMLTGFALVLLAAGLRAIPPELTEAARVDGAGEWQVFRRVTLPLLGPTLAVVTTTMAIAALKSFDIVYVLTNGAFGTDVVATRMYAELFSARHHGRASAIAVLLLIVILPVIAWNLRAFRRQEATR